MAACTTTLSPRPWASPVLSHSSQRTIILKTTTQPTFNDITEPRLYEDDIKVYNTPPTRHQKTQKEAHIAPPRPKLNSPALWLALYFITNLSLTLYNKSILIHFPFPYTLTAIHALCGTIGGYILESKGFFVRKQLGGREKVVMVMFSVLYSVNIVVSNASLRIVTVPVSCAFLSDKI